MRESLPCHVRGFSLSSAEKLQASCRVQPQKKKVAGIVAGSDHKKSKYHDGRIVTAGIQCYQCLQAHRERIMDTAAGAS